MPKGIQSSKARLVNQMAQLKRVMPPEEFARLLEADGALKWCGACKQLLPPDRFRENQKTPDGLSKVCRACGSARSAASHRKRLAEDPGYRALLKQRTAESRARARANGNLQLTQRKQALRAYGLTLETFAAMLAAQRFRCAICRRPFKGAHDTNVDHDHACCPPSRRRTCGNCVRGILCNCCNTALGKFRDDPAILRRAIRYLGTYRIRDDAPRPRSDQGLLWEDSGAA